MVSDEQVKRLRRLRMDGKTQAVAAVMSGMSERTARAWEQRDELPSEVSRRRRTWRTRKDPFAGVWEEEILPLLEADEAGKLQAKTLFDDLVERHPGRFQPGQRRTLERRVRDWRAACGPEKEVMFPQQHPPGREGVLDFTHGTGLGVRIAGVVLHHLLFVFKLSHSGWTWAQVAFGETYEALLDGLQGALWALGGVPEVVRHDNLSAATHELKRAGGRGLTKRFEAALEHYGLRSTRIRPGEAHENGVAERGNGLLKQALEQALILRGNRDFGSLGEYQVFLDEVIARRLLRPAAAKIAEERAALHPLPSSRLPSYTSYQAKVRSYSTLRIGSRSYSVPSRLIGHQVDVKQHANHLEVYYKGRCVESIPRLRGKDTVRIDYRHVIWSLARKPGAFAAYRYREELFPSLTFRRAYDALRRFRGERADIEYVRILHLAASTLESEVDEALALLLDNGERFDYAALKELVEPEKRQPPEVRIPAPDLSRYDALYLAGGGR
jgi:transposase